MNDLNGRTIIMSGGSRGIGLAIAQAAAASGANITILAKTEKPDARLPGTIHTAVESIRSHGGEAIGVAGDVRSESDVSRAIFKTMETFGAIDCVINNASAITTAGTLDTSNKKFDLMIDVNVRGTWLLTNAALPHLLKGEGGRVVTLSPPLNLSPRWLGAHPAYTASKYAMTLLTLGWAAEYSHVNMAAYCLWPETLIDTAAVRNVVGGHESARGTAIVVDAAMALFRRSPELVTGRAFIDADVLVADGCENFAIYGGGPHPTKDIFVD